MSLNSRALKEQGEENANLIRMRSVLVLRVGFILLVLCVGAGQKSRAQNSQAVATAQREIEALSRRSEADAMRKEVKACLSYFAEDYQGQDMDGRVWNKAQAGVNLTKAFQLAKTMRSHSTLKDVHLVDGNAIVLSQEHTILEIVGKKTGKLHTLVFDGQWRSTWIKKQGVWQVWREKHLSRTITRDGVVVPSKTSKSANP